MDLGTLAESGASTLVALMVSDAWEQIRSATAACLHRAGIAGAIDEDLARSRELVLAASAEQRGAVTTRISESWRERLLAAVDDADAAHETLGSLTDQLNDLRPIPVFEGGRVTLEATAKGNSRVFQQGYGNQYNR